MIRFLSVAAVAAATLSLTPATGFAQSVGYYAATPATAPGKTSVITRTTLWKCGDGVCTAAKSDARDPIMCQLVAEEVGKLSAFAAGGKTFDADALAKCNSRAR